MLLQNLPELILLVVNLSLMFFCFVSDPSLDSAVCTQLLFWSVHSGYVNYFPFWRICIGFWTADLDFVCECLCQILQCFPLCEPRLALPDLPSCVHLRPASTLPSCESPSPAGCPFCVLHLRCTSSSTHSILCSLLLLSFNTSLNSLGMTDYTRVIGSSSVTDSQSFFWGVWLVLQCPHIR